jgi:hypothetical protein
VSQREWEDAHLINAADDIHADDSAFGYRFIPPSCANAVSPWTRTFAPGTGCVATTSNTVQCSPTGILTISVDAGDSNDVITHTATTPSRLFGGPGDDVINGGQARHHVRRRWRRGGEVALEQVPGAGGELGRHGGAPGLAAPHAAQHVGAHQPLDRAANHRHALAVQLTPDLAGAVDAVASRGHLPMRAVSCSSRTARGDGGRDLAAQ